jgi:hypothetical protein
MAEDQLTFSPEVQASLQRQIRRDFKNDVPDTPELRRVLSLPRRVWETDVIENVGTVEDLAAQLSGFLRTPDGEQTLWPLQAKALQEAHDLGNLFGPIPVGDGKTLITYLAPTLLRAERPLLVVPAKLGKKTRREFGELQEHWQAPGRYPIVSYEKVSREGGTKLLEDEHPDLLVFDEVHRLKNKNAAVTRRITKWMKEHPHTRVVALSGTITLRSLLDFAHVLAWCLPAPLRPLPQTPRELEAWAAAVDEIKSEEKRMAAGLGALVLFCNDEERAAGRDGVRSAIRRRIQETPGVVASKGQDVKASLNITLQLVDGYNERTHELAQGLNEGVQPNGEIITDEDLSTRWRMMRTLTSGFWYEWQPPPPAEWLKARRAWKKCVRVWLNKHIPGMESELLVTKRAAAGELDDGAKVLYGAWLDVRGTYEPNVVPVWEDDAMVRRVRAWTKAHTGIVWVSEVALGERLESELGLPYFHRMGLDRNKRPIEEALPADGCIVASVGGNSEGRNLQAWRDNVVVSPPPTGTVWEQMLGRTHRPGQTADEVWFDVLIGCRVEWLCWLQALRDARYASRIENPKKLTYATVTQDFELPGGNSLWN